MVKFIIERELPGAGNLSQTDLQGISQKSCRVLNTLGSDIQWVESFVTSDKIYCVYISHNEQLIEEHAKMGGFSANKISKVEARIDPTTGGA
jgi:hypothetical protein